MSRLIKSGVCRQIFATLTASLCMVITGMWLGWPSSVVEKFIKHETDFNVDADQLSWIVSMMDLGNVISPLFAGHLMDKMGRKPILVLIGPLFMTTWLLTLYVPTIWSLYTARLLAGMGKGMSYTVLPVYLGEIANAKIRGALSSVFSFQLYSGLLLEVVVGPLVSYRTLNTVSAFFPMAFVLLMFWIPESPFYLLKKNRRSEAAQCLVWFRSDGCDANGELRQMEISVKKETENKSTFSELLTSRKYRSALMVVVMACVSQRAGGVSSMSAYSSIILSEPSSIMEKSGCITLFFLTMLVMHFVGASLVDKMGRKPLLIVSELGTGTVTFVFALYFYLSGHVDVSQQFTCIPYVCYVLFSATYAVGVGFIPMVFLGELFPVNIRSRCSAIATITLAVCSFISNKIFLFVSLKFGYHVMFGLFTVVNVISAIYSYMYAIETKGKTLLEIQELLEASVNSSKKAKDERINMCNPGTKK